MNHALISRALTAFALCTGAAGAFAHEGHGLEGVHMHSSDTAGFIVVAVLATLAIWLSHGE
ncbi:MAG: hypothetical protein JWQ07_937 [Ramlibacter sp.]|nr:hypothetical protein [Ramlibacter sp.]